MPSVTVRLPLVPTLTVAPWPPIDVLTPDFDRFNLTPGRTLMILRKRKPMVCSCSYVPDRLRLKEQHRAMPII